MSEVSGRSRFMYRLSAALPRSEDSERSRWVVVLRPRGVGGVAAAIDAVTPHLPDGVRVLPVSRRPADLVGALLAAGPGALVHLHPSLRERSVLRDGALHRLVRAAGARTLVHWHGVDRELLRRIDASPSRRAWLRRTFGDADRTFVAAPELAEAWTRWGLGPADVVANPAPTGLVRRRPDPHRILFLGRLVASKGVRALGAAHQLVRRRAPSATLALAGQGPCQLSGPGVRPLGWLDAEGRSAELGRAAVLALPTRDDAAPLVVLEALAAGVPVVATRMGAIPAMVRGHGVLLDRPDPASIATAIERVWEGDIGPPPDLSSHRPSAVAARWVATYRAIA